MVSIGPYTQAYDMRQMYDFVDLRGKKKEISYPENSLMYVINEHSDFKIFSGIVKKARYDSILANQQSNYTVFVPSDQHLIKKYSDESRGAKEYFDNIDIGSAIQILKYSLMNRIIDKNLLVSSPVSIFPTLERSNSVKIYTIRGITSINIPNPSSVYSNQNRDIQIIHFNQPSSNGIIHVTNDLLCPPILS